MVSAKALALILSFAAASLISAAKPARADSITIGVPTGGICFPACPGVVWMHWIYQQLYNHSSFPTTPIRIESIDLFPLYGAQYTTIDVYLSTSKRAFNDMSGIFAENVGSDNLLFGSYSLSTFLPPIASFQAANPFPYDPAKGDLLMNVLSTTTAGLTTAAAQGAYDGQRQLWDVRSGAADWTVGRPSSDGVVTRFQFTPVPGPAPLLGAAALFGYSRKLRNRIQMARRAACHPDV